MISKNTPDISVIICTYNRRDSLRLTLESLAEADREGLRVDLIVVENTRPCGAEEVCKQFSRSLPIRYYFEPRPGKYFSLNRALDSGSLGELVVLLDDDMSVDRGWFQGIRSISERYPDYDYFTGRTLIAWPDEEVPKWAHHRFLRPWAFSVIDLGEQDLPVKPGQWLSGNHYWFRSRVLEDGRRFRDFWGAESNFNLQLAEDGYRGMIAADAVATHRIQPDLLKREVIWERAKKCGCAWAHHRLPYYKTIHHARRLHDHPLLARVFYFLNGIRWGLLFLRARLYRDSDRRFAESCVARVGFYSCVETLRIARKVEAYWKNPGQPFSPLSGSDER